MHRNRQKGSGSQKGKRITFRTMLLTAVLALSTAAGYYLISRPKTVDLWVGETRIKAEIADTPQLRAKGLKGRKRLKEGGGMLFVFEYTRKQSFWMKDTSIPLSIAFISPDGTIRQIEQMKPFELGRVTSHSPVQYALEANQGFFKENGITVGMPVDLTNVTNK
ncbi:MAG: DUF192 domain-containing protein [Planctomycetota bacterium]